MDLHHVYRAKGYRKYLHAAGTKFTIDEAKVKWEERFDGKWVLQTDLEEMTAEDTALQYKQLWIGSSPPGTDWSCA